MQLATVDFEVCSSQYNAVFFPANLNNKVRIQAVKLSQTNKQIKTYQWTHTIAKVHVVSLCDPLREYSITSSELMTDTYQNKCQQNA